MINRISAIILLALLLASGVGVSTVAASTPTPTPTPTFTNGQIIGASTISPPFTCGSPYVPCGPMPFQLPRLSTMVLPSPTLIEIYANPAGSGTPTATPTATLNNADIGTLTGEISDTSKTLAAQTTQIVLIGGTPSTAVDIAERLGENVGSVFSIARALELTYFNQAGGVISFFILAIGFVLLIKIGELILPIILALVRLVLQLIAAIKPF